MIGASGSADSACWRVSRTEMSEAMGSIAWLLWWGASWGAGAGG